MNFDFKKWLLSQSVKDKKFFNCSGNGKAVPEYELKDGKLILLEDKKTGEVLTHNLYNDIQASAHVNDYLKILNDNPDALEQVKFATRNGNYEEVDGFDYTKLGSFNDLVQASQKLKAAGFNSFDDVIKTYNSYVESKKVKDLKQVDKKVDDKDVK